MTHGERMARSQKQKLTIILFGLFVCAFCTLAVVLLLRRTPIRDAQFAGTVGVKGETTWQGIRPSFEKPAWFDPQNWDAGVPNSNTDVLVNNGSFTGRYNIEIPEPHHGDTARTRDLVIESGGKISFAHPSEHALIVVEGKWIVREKGGVDLGSGTLILQGDILLQSGAKCEAHTGSIIFSGQSWESNSLTAFDAGNSKVIFQGASGQMISGEISYYDLEVHTPDTLRIVGRVSVTYSLTIADGSHLIVEPGGALAVSGSISNQAAVSGLGSISISGSDAAVASANRETSVPETITLRPNYPNPFNPSTTIEFSVLNREHTSLRVFDIQGREVRTLFSEVTDPGRTYRMTFRADGLASGTYLYVLQSGSQRKVGRMIFQK